MKFVLPCLFILALLISSCKTNRPVPPETTMHSRMMVPNPPELLKDEGVSYYKVIENVFDRKWMTRISIALVLKDGITPANVEALLRKYYRDADARHGFRFRDHATDIDVAAYASPEHMASEYEQWIAIITKAPVDSAPRLRLDSVQFAQVGAPAIDRFGLSDSQRRLVFRKLIQEQYHDPHPSPELTLATDSLLKSHPLSQAVLDSIHAEGLAKHWAFPPMHTSW